VLAQLVVSGANFLVLDEPTNHLDIESREALEDALSEFAGTLLFVSHDRALIEALATRTLAIEHGRLTLRDGAFGEYARDHEPSVDGAARQAEAPRRERKQPKPAAARPATPRPAGRNRREAERLEKQIESMEQELGSLEARLSQPDAYEQPDALVEDGLRHRRLQEDLAHLYREWELRAEG
jgi:ATP-binding cassette, subfamily F, member 3